MNWKRKDLLGIRDLSKEEMNKGSGKKKDPRGRNEDRGTQWG
jgi:hypothetical protein